MIREGFSDGVPLTPRNLSTFWRYFGDFEKAITLQPVHIFTFTRQISSRPRDRLTYTDRKCAKGRAITEVERLHMYTRTGRPTTAPLTEMIVYI